MRAGLLDITVKAALNFYIEKIRAVLHPLLTSRQHDSWLFLEKKSFSIQFFVKNRSKTALMRKMAPFFIEAFVLDQMRRNAHHQSPMLYTLQTNQPIGKQGNLCRFAMHNQDFKT
jgi:hypothetical protein